MSRAYLTNGRTYLFLDLPDLAFGAGFPFAALRAFGAAFTTVFAVLAFAAFGAVFAFGAFAPFDGLDFAGAGFA